MSNKRVHVWISGRVQGVFFRAYTRDAALEAGVTGWVRNLSDGRVEAVFQGDPERVERMLAWCHQGSPGSRVDQVQMREEPVQEEFTGCEIRYRMP
jgi:acylphosphatase